MFLGDILSLKFLLHQKEMGFLDLKSSYIGLDKSADSKQMNLWCSTVTPPPTTWWLGRKEESNGPDAVDMWFSTRRDLKTHPDPTPTPGQLNQSLG